MQVKKKFETFNPGTVFIVIILVFLVPLAYYFFSWVPERTARLSDQYLRSAAVMSDRLETRGKNIAAVIEKAAITLGADQVENQLKQWLTSLLHFPTMDVDFTGEKPGTGEFHIDVTYDPGDEQFVFSIKKDVTLSGKIPKNKNLEFNLKIDADDFVGDISRRQEFDDVFIMDKNGKIIYRRSQHAREGIKSGLRFLNLDIPGPQPAKQDKTGAGEITLDGLHSRIASISIAASNYKLFVQPVPLKFVDTGAAPGEGAHWFVGGLLYTAAFEKRTRKISNNLLLLFILLLLLAFVSYPLIKLWLMGPADRFRPRDVVLLILSLVVAIPIILYFITTASNYYVIDKNYQDEMKNLADRIHDNFTNEIQDAYDQLSVLVKHEDRFLYKKDSANAPGKTGAGLLQELGKKGELVYPYFDMAFIMDETGEQRFKRVVDNTPVTLHNVSHREYFKKIKAKQYWFTGNGQPMMLEAVYSQSTGRYELNLSLPLSLAAAGLSFRPLSVLEPVMPGGYGFAIIDAAGKVIFHSDHCLNGNENFFSECTRGDTVKAAIFAGAEEWIDDMYHGKRRDLYLRPVKNVPWLLIVFRDRDANASRNLERIYRAVLHYSLYAFILIILYFLYKVLRYFQEKAAGIRAADLYMKGRWLVPDKRLQLQYTLISALNFILFILLLVQLYFSEKTFFGGLFIPLASLFLAYMVIMKSLVVICLGPDKTGKKLILLVKNFIIGGGMLVIAVFLVVHFNAELLGVFANSRSVIILPVFLYFLLLFIPGKIEEKIKHKKISRSWFYQQSHTLMIYTFLLLLIAYPSLMFYESAYDDENLTNMKYNHIIFARDYARWNKQRKINYKSQEEAALKHWEKEELKIYAEKSGVYTAPSFKTYMISESRVKAWLDLDREEPASPAQAAQFIENEVKHYPPVFPGGSTGFFQHILYMKSEIQQLKASFSVVPRYTDIIQIIGKIIPFDNLYSEKVRYLYGGNYPHSPLKWGIGKEGGIKKIYLKYDLKADPGLASGRVVIEPFYVISELPRIRRMRGGALVLLTGVFLAALFLTAVLYSVVNFIAKFIFLKDLAVAPNEKTFLYSDQLKAIPGKFFIFGKDAHAVKKDCQEKECITVDCRDSDIDKKIEAGLSQDREGRKFIIIYNFDAGMHDGAVSLSRLRLLEHLVFNHDINLMVFSQFEPRQYFAVPVEQGEAEAKKEHPDLSYRWQRVLSQLEFRYILPRPPKSEPPSDLPGERLAFIANECQHPGYLQGVMNRIFDDLKETGVDDISLAGLRERIYEYAKPVYDEIWRTSTREEKAVMLQLARDGLVNVKNKETVRRLLKRGLIRLKPLRLLNRTFREYVTGNPDSQSILQWKESQTRSSWSKVKRPFLMVAIGVMAFLVVTQPDLLQSWLIIIPAISTTIPAILRLFDQVTGSTGQST
jgi:hypothetical protein